MSITSLMCTTDRSLTDIDISLDYWETWCEAEFRVIEHLVFRKQYCSQSRFLGYQHEQAYLLAKGRPKLPAQPISDVLERNKMHPTRKPVSVLMPLI